MRRGHPWLMIGLSFASALISAVFLASPWNILVIALNAAIVLLAVIDLKVRNRQTAEHEFLMGQTPEGELAILAEGQAAARQLDDLVRVHFEEVPETTAIACRYCNWRTDDFADRLRLAPAHLREAHPEHDPRVPRLFRFRATRPFARFLPRQPTRR